MKAHWIVLSFTTSLFSFSASAIANEELARKNTCFECHKIDQDLVGPSYKKVAAKYRGQENARNVLIEKVKHGSKGNWTEISRGVPMPPFYPSLSETEIEQLVDWVLSQ